MLFAAFKLLGIQLIVFSVIIAVCSLIACAVNGQQAGVDLVQTAVTQMKGPWVWTFGYGLMCFVMRRGRFLPAIIDGVLESNEVTARVIARIQRSTLHQNAYRYTVPVTLTGVFLTFVYGIPNHGIARYLIFVGVCSIYYVGSFILFHFVEVTLAFHELFESIEKIKFKKKFSPLHLENLTTYLALTTGLGLIGIYGGFRGTVTAGFQFPGGEVWRAFLLTPLLLFLPGTLFYNYYPRYVLRKILQYKVFETMEQLNGGDELSAREVVLELKENAVLDAQILPFIDYKTLPAYLIAILFVISLTYNNDPAVKSFVEYLLSLGSK